MIACKRNIWEMIATKTMATAEADMMMMNDDECGHVCSMCRMYGVHRNDGHLMNDESSEKQCDVVTYCFC